MGRYATAGTIIERAAIELGLSVPAATAYSSTDPIAIQLRGLLASAGQSLILDYGWSNLQKEHTFTTVAGTESYRLPDDFLQMCDQSGWNRTTRFPLGGPLSPQEWQYLKAAVVGVVFNVLIRMDGENMRLFPSNVSGHTIAYEYLSRDWVLQGGAFPAGPITHSATTTGTFTIDGDIGDARDFKAVLGTPGVTSLPFTLYQREMGDTEWSTVGPILIAYGVPYTWGSFTFATTGVQADYTALDTFYWSTPESTISSDAPADYGDEVLFEPLLMIRALKLGFLEAKGFDTAAAQRAYDQTFESVRGNINAAPRLSLNGPGTIRDRLIDSNNLPICGYGSTT